MMELGEDSSNSITYKKKQPKKLLQMVVVFCRGLFLKKRVMIPRNYLKMENNFEWK